MSITYEHEPQKFFTPFPKELLPEGFRYPERYISHSQSMDYPKYFLWWFSDNKEKIDSDWTFRHHWQSEGWLYLDEIDPIPFARNGDWAAYFDGNDHSGDPRVVVADLGNKKNSYKLSNFDVWLDQALKDSGLE